MQTKRQPFAGLMVWRGKVTKMTDGAKDGEAFARRRNRNSGLKTLDSLYYEYTRKK